MDTQTVGEERARSSAEPTDAWSVDVDELTDASRRWFTLTALGCRLALTVPAVLLNRGLLGAWGDRLLPLTVSVILLDGLLIVGALRRPALLSSWWLFAADMGVTVAMTVAATLLIAPNTFLVAGHDALTGYGWGTVVLWTAVRGWRTGISLVIATPVLQLVMAALNQCVLDAHAVASIVLRTGIAVINLVIAASVVALAARGSRRVVAEGLRAGRLAERADALRRYHDTALAELDAIVLTARSGCRSAAERLSAITGRARELARSWQSDDTDAETDLGRGLGRLVTEFAARNLDVDVRGAAVAEALEDRPAIAAAAIGATREALNNVVKHAGVRNATITVRATDATTEIDIRDDGAGFLPAKGQGFGLRSSIIGRISDVGGTATIASAPGAGTRVRLVLPSGPLPGSPHTVEESVISGALAWFLVVPVIFRMIALPVVDFSVAPFVPQQALVLHGIVATLVACHGAVLIAQLRHETDHLWSSNGAFVLDLAAAAGLYLWTAAAVAPGAVTYPGPDGAWMYVLGTVPLWIAARGLRVGGAVLLGAVMLEVVAIAVNGDTPAVNPMLVLQHVVMVIVVAAYTALIMYRARVGADAALVASLRAGRQRERIDVLTILRSRVVSTLSAIGEPCPSDETVDRLQQVALLAAVTADELRTALRTDSAAANGSQLVARLTALAARLRRNGLAIKTVVTEVRGEPPPPVIELVVTAVQESLEDLAARAPAANVVLRVSSGARDLDVTMRDASGQLAIRPDTASALGSVAGRVTTVRSGPAVRTSLHWSTA